MEGSNQEEEEAELGAADDAVEVELMEAFELERDVRRDDDEADDVEDEDDDDDDDEEDDDEGDGDRLE